MKLLRLIGIVGVVALLSTLNSVSVYAFQETQIAPLTADTGDAPEKAQKAGSGAAEITGSTELTTPDIDASLSEGTDINIPGLGTIGKLPKLDFGLEMLYGVDEKSNVVAPISEEDNPESEVMIRGTVKHRF